MVWSGWEGLLVVSLLATYWLSAGTLAAFGLYYLSVFSVRLTLARRATTSKQGVCPFVTVQIPVRNERYVVARALEAATRLSWPHQRLEIQVLDDSQDETTEIAARAVRRAREDGFAIAHLRRPHPIDFKAGALNHGLTTARGSLIAVFDADFVPPPDFLLKTVPLLEPANVACVQTRWTHLNEPHSWLTRSISLALDAHFAVEQEVRARFGLVMSFNATSCVWKRASIEATGGWPTRTITEDLDITLQTLIRGESVVYVDTPRVPCEVPVEVLGFANQQARWARGGAQNLRLHARGIVGAKTLGVAGKLDALVHLVHYAFQPALLGLFASNVGFAFVDAGPHVPASMALAVVAALGPLLILADGQRRSHPRRWALRLWPIVPLSMVGAGICLRVAWAFMAGLFLRHAAFMRTPKYALEGNRGTWRGSTYVPRADAATIVEGLAAALAAWGAWTALDLGRVGLALSLGVFAACFAAVSTVSAAEGLPGAKPRR